MATITVLDRKELYGTGAADPHAKYLLDKVDELAGANNTLAAELQGGPSTDTVKIVHNATPDTPGEPVKVVEDGFLATLWCNNAGGTADSYVETAGADALLVKHNATPPGNDLYWKDGVGFMCNLAVMAKDAYVALASGLLFKITYNSNPSGAGAQQVFFDDDAATETDRLLQNDTGTSDRTVAVEADRALAPAVS